MFGSSASSSAASFVIFFILGVCLLSLVGFIIGFIFLSTHVLTVRMSTRLEIKSAGSALAVTTAVWVDFMDGTISL